MYPVNEMVTTRQHDQCAAMGEPSADERPGDERTQDTTSGTPVDQPMPEEEGYGYGV